MNDSVHLGALCLHVQSSPSCGAEYWPHTIHVCSLPALIQAKLFFGTPHEFTELPLQPAHEFYLLNPNWSLNFVVCCFGKSSKSSKAVMSHCCRRWFRLYVCSKHQAKFTSSLTISGIESHVQIDLRCSKEQSADKSKILHGSNTCENTPEVFCKDRWNAALECFLLWLSRWRPWTFNWIFQPLFFLEHSLVPFPDSTCCSRIVTDIFLQNIAQNIRFISWLVKTTQSLIVQDMDFPEMSCFENDSGTCQFEMAIWCKCKCNPMQNKYQSYLSNSAKPPWT